MRTGTTGDRGGRRLRRTLRTVLLAVVLGTVGLVVPEPQVQPADVALVRMRGAEAIGQDRRVVWILAVGSDARPGQRMTRARGDAIQLVGLDTRTGAATAIGIPRDSWVGVPGHGHEKIDAALYFGGPRGMARAVGGLVGVQVDYVVVSRFPFFENMVDDIGGIRVRNPRPFSDPNLRPRGFAAGWVRLDGYGAMGFARIRKTLPGGDFDRSSNQQRVLRGIQRAVAARADRPGFMERAVLTVLRHTHTDLSPQEVFRLGQSIARLDPGRITTCVVRGRVGSVGAASVVFPDRGHARRLGADARRDAHLGRC